MIWIFCSENPNSFLSSAHTLCVCSMCLLFVFLNLWIGRESSAPRLDFNKEKKAFVLNFVCLFVLNWIQFRFNLRDYRGLWYIHTHTQQITHTTHNSQFNQQTKNQKINNKCGNRNKCLLWFIMKLACTATYEKCLPVIFETFDMPLTPFIEIGRNRAAIKASEAYVNTLFDQFHFSIFILSQIFVSHSPFKMCSFSFCIGKCLCFFDHYIWNVGCWNSILFCLFELYVTIYWES